MQTLKNIQQQQEACITWREVVDEDVVGSRHQTGSNDHLTSFKLISSLLIETMHSSSFIHSGTALVTYVTIATGRSKSTSNRMLQCKECLLLHRKLMVEDFDQVKHNALLIVCMILICILFCVFTLLTLECGKSKNPSLMICFGLSQKDLNEIKNFFHSNQFAEQPWNNENQHGF